MRRHFTIVAALVTTLLVLVQTPAVALEQIPGTGKRVVYSKSENRVWLVNADDTLYGTWQVTGNPARPAPGNYHVYSRSSVTRSINGKYTFTHMVRFARTAKGIGIGFHAIPYNSRTKTPIMPLDKIGSHKYVSGGCVRQSLPNAERMWAWATIGTPVIVVR